jgi:membrane protease YdiL (CAAX protease family)
VASSGKKKSSSDRSTTGKGQNSRTGGSATPRAPKPGSPAADGDERSGSGSGSRRKAKIPESSRPQPRARGGTGGRSSSGGGSRNGRARSTGDGQDPSTADGDLGDDVDAGDDIEVVDDVEVIDDETGATIGGTSLKDRVTTMFSGLTAPQGRDTDTKAAPRRTSGREKAEPVYREDGSRVPTWGLGDVAVAFLLSIVAATVSYLPLQALGYLPGVGGNGWAVGEVSGHVAIGQAPAVAKGFADSPIALQVVLSYVPLWLGLMVPTAYAVWKKGNGFVRDLGLRFEWVDVPIGLGVGAGCQLVLVPLIYFVVSKLLPNEDVGAIARSVTDKAVDPFSTILILLVVGVGAPVVEEIYYRGLTLRAAERRFGPSWALIGTSAYFALVHAAPILLPGLMVFALIIGYMAQRFGRLGPSIFAHIGFNLVTAVVLIWNINVAWIV